MDEPYLACHDCYYRREGSGWEGDDYQVLVHCPLHAAARQLLDACKAFIAAYPGGINPYLAKANSMALDAVRAAEEKKVRK